MTYLFKQNKNIDKMKQKLENIFTFLIENRQFNHTFQKRVYESIILPYTNKTDKIISLIYHIANTQSRPKIDSLAGFYKNIFQDTSCMTSMNKFLSKISPSQPLSYDSLYIGMKNQDGWGKKTAALFSKSIYQLHNCQYDKKLRIWNDAPMLIEEGDNLYLPVDSVIIAVFKKLDSSQEWNFCRLPIFSLL